MVAMKSTSASYTSVSGLAEHHLQRGVAPLLITIAKFQTLRLNPMICSSSTVAATNSQQPQIVTLEQDSVKETA